MLQASVVTRMPPDSAGLHCRMASRGGKGGPGRRRRSGVSSMSEKVARATGSSSFVAPSAAARIPISRLPIASPGCHVYFFVLTGEIAVGQVVFDWTSIPNMANGLLRGLGPQLPLSLEEMTACQILSGVLKVGPH